MRFLLLLLLIVNFIEAKWLSIEGLYTHSQAQEACSKTGLRLPEIYELFTLKGLESYPKDTSYWSNSEVRSLLSRSAGGEIQKEVSKDNRPAYAFYQQDGDISITPKSKKIHVLCQDTAFSSQDNRSFESISEGILDEDNDIVWQRLTSSDKHNKYTFEDATKFCSELELFDMAWRLPTLEELFSLVEYQYFKPTINKNMFKFTMQRYYLSSSELRDMVYVVGFKLGSVATSSQQNKSYVRCVSEDTP